MMVGGFICRRLDMTWKVTHALRTVFLIFSLYQVSHFLNKHNWKYIAINVGMLQNTPKRLCLCLPVHFSKIPPFKYFG